MTPKPDLDAAADFIWLNARLLDRYRFAHLFLGGPAEPVVDAMRAYRNPDGGFGNALEPDLRAPGSQPLAVEHVLRILEEVDRFDDPMVTGILEWLQTETRPNGGVPFMLPAGLAQPRAPWMQTEDDPPGGLVPTASLAGVLHSHDVRDPWLDRATEFCWEAIESAGELLPYDLIAILTFLERVPDRERARATFEKIAPSILRHTAMDPHAEGEVFQPLDFAPSPQAPARALYQDDVIEAHLDALTARQQADGGWIFNWLAWNPASAIDWRGFVTIHTLQTLRAYGRV
jgi:hypothetical protein